MQKSLKYRISAFVLIVLTVAFLLGGCGNKDASQTADSADAQEATEAQSDTDSAEPEVVGLEYPYVIDDGRLTVTSVFTSQIDNPDADNQSGENIVTVELQNTSGQFLDSVDLTITLADGTTVPVHIADVPDHEKVWGFASDNTESTEVAVEITADTSSYEDAAPLATDTFQTSVDDTTITLTNISGETQNNIEVYCHTKFDDVLFGGITYTYTVDSLSAGETTTIDAVDCWLGEPEVVSITANE